MRRLSLVLLLLLLAACGKDGEGVGADSPGPALQLRLVTSSAAAPCEQPALMASVAGTACGWDGTWTYVVGPSLGEVGSEVVRYAENDGQATLEVDLDEADAAQFADLTAASTGKQVAFLLRGRVVSAPTILSRITGGSLQLTAEPAVLREVASLLRAETASPEPSPLGVSAEVAAEQQRVCAAAQPRLAPRGEVAILSPRSAVPAGTLADLYRANGDRDGAAVWAAQPADAPVFLCTYSLAPMTTAPTPSPGCRYSLQELPLFYVDARGHATRFPIPGAPSPGPTC